MATNFPNSPSNGDTHTFGGATYTYNSTRGAWLGPSSGGSGGASVTVSETAPTSPSEGDLWFDPSVLKTFVYYNDGTTNQWVQNNPTGGGGSGGGGASVTVSETAPSSPSAGDLWWSSSEAVMYIYYTDADSSQWVQATTPGADGAAGADGSAAVYATIDLLPASANTGDQAFVTGSNRLYLWNGTGWYNIALINTNPSISGVSSSYALAIDGTATTVTIVASDPEGIPITYSLASDTSGSIATVAQGTGSNTNVFTITPSTSSANAGTFTLTFRASDGVNLASAPAEFSLEFSVVNSNYTSALITSVGADNAVNNAFIDSSSNSHTITVSGDAHQTTFSPYRHGGYSLESDGSGGGYIKTDTHADFVFGTGNFTVECWYKPLSKAQNYPRILHFGNYWSNTKSWGILDRHNSSNTTFTVQSSALGTILQSTTTVTNNQWYHLAVVRNGTTITFYIDGVAEDTYDISTNNYPDASSTSWLNLLNVSDGSNLNEAQANGQLRDARVVKGTAVYTADFTPTTESLTAVTYTTFLLGGTPYLVDASTSAHSFTESGGDYTFKPTGPYDYSSYSSAANGGSLKFDGAGDRLEAPQTNVIGTNDFTLEAWVYPESFGATEAFFCTMPSGSASLQLNVAAAGALELWYSGTATSNRVSIANVFNEDTWHHIAVVGDGTTNEIKIYKNGVQIGTTISYNYNYSGSGNYKIGVNRGGTTYFHGHVTDVRLVVGTKLYTSTFTPPTSPLTAVTNTEILLKGTNAGIIDKSQTGKSIALKGNVKSSTTAYKYLTSSMAFDGTGDYIDIPVEDQFGFGTGDFTVEFWFNYTGTMGTRPMQLGTGVNGSSHYSGWAVRIESGNSLQFERYSGGHTNYTFGTFSSSAGNWHHLAITRAGTTLRGFIDGTQIGSDLTSSLSFDAHNTTDPLRIGWGYDGRGNFYWNGYMSDVRLTKGLARYTAAFTPPTAALKG
jgi:hypothetical protein